MASFAEPLPAAESEAAGTESRTLIRWLPLRDRLILLSGLGIVILLAWVYLVDMARAMDGMSNMPHGEAMLMTWNRDYFAAMLLMWVIMMVGMMVPTAIPMVMIHAAVGRKAARDGATLAPTWFFVTGYLVIWNLFSLAATVAQWALDRASLLSPLMMSNSPIVGGILLLGAGLYQLTPIKAACLRHCRSPVHFMANHWRSGRVGAIRMGCEHGLYCLGCCWVLMGLLFFGGVMSIWWIGGLTLLVLLEKIMPRGLFVGRILGVLAIGWGAALLLQSR